ncbi:MarR family transcriptional regulator [Isoptericola sp. S6320L]|uniref:MarR family winged helix-turn-helix transcriptional regulator n=1 Tax=Isoptericola sp. S6320L TaxID=2926411 RepID=UPI001FF276E2|nr:MarR family transcriptional regulator [Isoptericola sp. S6320L]MCK0117690.1 MarR family transcriptional regulator [Isoptericola sp. S6320L]
MFDEELRRFSAGARDDLGFLLLAAADAVVAATLAEVAAQGYPEIRRVHVPVFVHLDPDGTTISALAEQAGVTRQAMTGVVRELEGLGYVVTAPDPGDRRARRVTLTGHGAEYCRAATQVSERLTDRWREELGDEAVDRLRDQLRGLTTGLPAPR